jgi:hypothetical protein
MARLRNSLLKLTLLLGLILAAGLIWREVVVETAVRLVLSSHGLGDARFEVVTVGRTEIVIENVSLGADLLSARRMRLTYDTADLVSGRLQDLRIEGLKFDPQRARDGTLARLENLASSEGGPPIELSRIVLENAEIVLGDSVARGGTLTVDGELDLSGGGLGAALDVGIDLGHTTAAFTIRSGDIDEGGVVDISGGGESELAGMPLPGRTGIAATGGHARFTVEGTAQIPAVDAAWPELWLAGMLSLKGGLRLSEVTTSIGPGVLSADISWALRGDNGSWRVDLLRPAQLVVQGIAPEILAALHLPAVDGAAQDFSIELSSSGPVVAWSPAGDGGMAEFAGDIAVELGDAAVVIRTSAKVEHDASWRLLAPAEVAFRVGATAIAFSGAEGSALLREAEWIAAGSLTPDGEIDLHGSLAAELRDVSLVGFKADAADVDGNVRLRQMPGRWSFAVVPGLTIAMEGVAVPGRLEIGEPVLLTMDSLGVASSDVVTQLKMSGSTNQVSGVLLDGEGQGFAFANAGGRMTLVLALGDRSEGEIRLEDAHVTLLGEAISLNAVFARLPLGADSELAAIVLSGEVRDSSRAARFPPIRIELEGERDGAIISVSGMLETLDRAVRLPLKGSGDLVEMIGRMIVDPTRVTFRKGGLQPGALSPDLATLRDVGGAVRISAASDLDADGTVRTALSLAFEDLSARIGDVEVDGLSGMVDLSQLFPFATAGPQRLKARRLIVGVPVDRPRARFAILPRRRGVLVRFHEAVGELAGGQIAVEDARWDSAAQTNAFDVRVRDVAIDRLLRDWQVEGITGTGRLSGVIPVRVGRAGLTVAGGRLDSAGAGVIRVDWGSARETLVKASEQVALTVNALADFHYDSLSIGIDQPEDGALTLAIGLEGANPAVLDGYPFRFNINLSGELAPILEAVREGRRIGAGLIQGGLGLRP